MEAADGAHAVCPGARAVLDDFELQHGEIALPDARFEHWLDALPDTPVSDREQVAHDLIALAVRFRRSGEPGADRGFSQLCALAVMVIDDVAALPTDGFEQAPAPSVTGRPPRALPRSVDDAPAGTALKDLLYRR